MKGIFMVKKNSLSTIDDLESFSISSSGSLLNDIKKIDIKLTQVPNIEVKEVIIKETGNFLNLKDSIINIPVEMIVFPFFTPQKQNKRVNFQYSFEDLGVTMYCTLVAKDAKDEVFQPSIFEEKIYTYLISMYEIKKEIEDSNDFIEFEISDFIVNFLGNKMNRTYYSKVEQALKNLKNTEYQFIVSNHTKLGKYKFEDEEFKLLTYQKLKRGKKIYYRVTLNKNIRQKIQDKRYIKYNSKALLEILSKDPIAGRIYKYISKIRYEKKEDKINLRTLAAIIPLKTEQITERVNKNGEKKIYILCRMKQVLKRIEKAFKILCELGYIKYYKTEYNIKEDNYYIIYMFDSKKDGKCHVSSFIEKKSPRNLGIIANKKNIVIEETKVIETKINNELNSINELSLKVIERIQKTKRNLYVSKAWDKRTDTKIKKIYFEQGEEVVLEVLKSLYSNLNNTIKTTLVQYINGILKNMRSEKIAFKKQNLTLFTTNKIQEVKEISKNMGNLKDIMEEYDRYDEYKKLQIEEQALKLCSQEEGIAINFLLTLKSKSKNIYMNTLKKYIEKIIKKEL
jgi:hypothetical protein